MELFWFFVFVLLLVVLIGTWPVWPYTESREWGYTPSAIAAMLLIVFFLLVWLGMIAVWWPWGAY